MFFNLKSSTFRQNIMFDALFTTVGLFVTFMTKLVVVYDAY